MSITAVDKQISDKLLGEVRDYPLISEYRVYVRSFKDNTFIGILAPHTWLYEWAEAWWPGSTWNVWVVMWFLSLTMRVTGGVMTTRQ